MNVIRPSAYLGLVFLSKMHCSFSRQVSHIFKRFVPRYFMFLDAIANAITKISSSLCYWSTEIELIFHADLKSRDRIK